MIPEPVGVKFCARAINAEQAKQGWDVYPSLFTLYSAKAPPVGNIKGGIINATAWPIPGELVDIDPVGVIDALAAEIRKRRWLSGSDSAPVAYAKRVAGPSFAGLGLIAEAIVAPVGTAMEFETRNVFIVDCGGTFTILTAFRDGPVHVYTAEEFDAVMDTDQDIGRALRDLVLGILKHCPEGTGDIAALRKIGATV